MTSIQSIIKTNAHREGVTYHDSHSGRWVFITAEWADTIGDNND